MKKQKTVGIVLMGGLLEDVVNLPRGWDYELIDYDVAEEEGIPSERLDRKVTKLKKMEKLV
jgi:hypothetical protein